MYIFVNYGEIYDLIWFEPGNMHNSQFIKLTVTYVYM